MNPILFIFLGIIGIFALIAIFKERIPWKACALCVGVTGTWITLYTLARLGVLVVPDIFLAVLMGQTVVGTYKLLEKRLPERLHLFRLPYVLSATLIAYLLITPTRNLLLMPAALIAALWGVLLIAYAYRNHARFRGSVERIIACCRDWA